MARKAAGYATAADAARARGWSPVAYRHHENGTAGYTQARAIEYAAAYHTTPEWLLFGRGPAPTGESGVHELGGEWTPRPVGRLPVLGAVAAGIWQEPAMIDPEDVEGYLPVEVPGYDQATLYALRVTGPSMNRYYPEGRYIVVAPVAETGVREGDHVVVRRNRAGLTETTVKEVVVEGDRIALWPRSTHEAHQTPIYIAGDEHDQDAPQIVAVVVADYAMRERGKAPIAVPPHR